MQTERVLQSQLVIGSKKRKNIKKDAFAKLFENLISNKQTAKTKNNIYENKNNKVFLPKEDIKLNNKNLHILKVQYAVKEYKNHNSSLKFSKKSDYKILLKNLENQKKIHIKLKPELQKSYSSNNTENIESKENKNTVPIKHNNEKILANIKTNKKQPLIKPENQSAKNIKEEQKSKKTENKKLNIPNKVISNKSNSQNIKQQIHTSKDVDFTKLQKIIQYKNIKTQIKDTSGLKEKIATYIISKTSEINIRPNNENKEPIKFDKAKTENHKHKTSIYNENNNSLKIEKLNTHSLKKSENFSILKADKTDKPKQNVIVKGNNENKLVDKLYSSKSIKTVIKQSSEINVKKINIKAIKTQEKENLNENTPIKINIADEKNISFNNNKVKKYKESSKNLPLLKENIVVENYPIKTTQINSSTEKIKTKSSKPVVKIVKSNKKQIASINNESPFSTNQNKNIGGNNKAKHKKDTHNIDKNHNNMLYLPPEKISFYNQIQIKIENVAKKIIKDKDFKDIKQIFYKESVKEKQNIIKNELVNEPNSSEDTKNQKLYKSVKTVKEQPIFNIKDLKQLPVKEIKIQILENTYTNNINPQKQHSSTNNNTKELIEEQVVNSENLVIGKLLRRKKVIMQTKGKVVNVKENKNKTFQNQTKQHTKHIYNMENQQITQSHNQNVVESRQLTNNIQYNLNNIANNENGKYIDKLDLSYEEGFTEGNSQEGNFNQQFSSNKATSSSYRFSSTINEQIEKIENIKQLDKKKIDLKISTKEAVIRATLINNRLNVKMLMSTEIGKTFYNDIENILKETGFEEYTLKIKSNKEEKGQFKKEKTKELNIKV